MPPAFRTQLLRRAATAAAAFGSILVLATCSDPTGSGVASLALRPVFAVSPGTTTLALDRVRVIVIRPPAETLAVVVRNFPVTAQSVTLDIPVAVSREGEDVEAHLELYSGTTLLYSGVEVVHATMGQLNTVSDVAVSYDGPGNNIAYIQITPRDTTVNSGNAFYFVATAVDSSAQPVSQFHVGWHASEGSLDAAGRFVAPATGSLVDIHVMTPTGISDATTVVVNGPAATGVTRTWVGTTADWRTASNWSPPGVPGSGDSVVMTATGQTTPYVLGNVLVRALTLKGRDAYLVVSGNLAVQHGIALLDTNQTIGVSGNLSAGSLTISGVNSYVYAAGSETGHAVVTGTTLISGEDAGIEVYGNQNNSFGPVTITGDGAFFEVDVSTMGPLTASSPCYIDLVGGSTINGAVTLTGDAYMSMYNGNGSFTINGNVSIGGTGAELRVANFGGLTINGSLQTTGAGFLNTYVDDTIRVNGNASFGGGNESGWLTAGVLRITGNLSQTTNPQAFVGGGTFTVLLAGTGAQTVNFANPGFNASTFQNLAVANTTGAVQLTSDAYMYGHLSAPAGATRKLNGNGSTLFMQEMDLATFTFNNLMFDYGFVGTNPVAFTGITFQGYATSASPLTISHPGIGAGGITLTGTSFSVVPTTGYYLRAIDTAPTDQVPLIINMTTPTPASSGGHVLTSGGATVNWPYSP